MAGETLDFATVTASTVYDGTGVLVKANVDPADATNKNVKWYIDNKDQFELKDEDKTAGTVKVVAKASCTSASSVHIWCVSEDGDIQSDVVTLCVVRNAAETNTINGDDLSVINGKTLDVSHAMTFSGSTVAFKVWLSPTLPPTISVVSNLIPVTGSLAKATYMLSVYTLSI